MDKLKKNIEEATAAVEQEREKNVSLLHLIFPPDIAKRLWLGKLGVYFICPGPDWIKSAGFGSKKFDQEKQQFLKRRIIKGRSIGICTTI